MLHKVAEYIKSLYPAVPETAVILGSGLGALADRAENAVRIPYGELEGFPVSTAPSHKGELILGTLGGKNVLLFSGRFHLYEGYSAKETVLTVRLAKALGAEKIILTNASGGINKTLNCGDFMLISDHISTFVPSPLIGKNDDSLGARFPDMSNVYDREIRKTVKKIAFDNGIELKEGVYAQLTGPQFETPAEIKMLANIGADAVGMSTVIEAIAAVHCGLKVCGISVIANLACGLLDKPLTSEEVTETANAKAPQFEKLVTETIRNI